MKNRPYEQTPVATEALAGSRSTFTKDYARVITWCLENCWVDTDPMSMEGRPPQNRFGLPD